MKHLRMIQQAQAYGMTFNVVSTDHGVSACLRDYGEFARPELDFISLVCRRALLDIGANIGAICLPFAKASPECAVVAIEALPPVARILSANVALNGLRNVTVIDAVAGEHEGTFETPEIDIESKDNLGATSLYDESSASLSRPMVQIDKVAPADVDFVKIDVEGFEPRVLAGGRALLERVRPNWLVEVSPGRQTEATAVIETLSRNGYRLYWFLSPFLTRKRPWRLDERPKLRSDLSVFATDAEPPWELPSMSPRWPRDVSEFPYLKAYGLVGASGPPSTRS